jgi:preprotein translocase subunit SecG
MGAIEIISGILLIIASIVIIMAVSMQEPKGGDGLDAMTGNSSADSYLGKNGGRTFDAMLKKFTKIAGIAFIVLVVLVNVIAVFF